MEEIIYRQLNSNELSSKLKEFKVVSVKLSKKRAKLTINFINSIRQLMGEDDQKLSTIKSFLVAIVQIVIIIRMMLFHSRLFQIFIFYFNTQPKFETEESDGFVKVSFFK